MNDKTDDRRIIFDLTTSALWSGPPVGIVRAERELARWALDHRPQTIFVVFDPRVRRYRRLSASFVKASLSGEALLSDWGLPDFTGARRRRSERLPRALYAILQGRRTLLAALERVRLSTRRPRLRGAIDRAQRALMSRRHRAQMIDERNRRRAFYPIDLAAGEPLTMTARDTLLCAGRGWSHTDIEAIAKLKDEIGFRFVVICYDLIPIQFPDYFKARDLEDVERYWRIALQRADRVIANSQAVAGDARQLAAVQGADTDNVVVCPLGANPTGMGSLAGVDLPQPLQPERYILFVSTIEPRKGHELLYRVWLKLLATGAPQASGFKLVFVGRPGWLMDKFNATLREDSRIRDSLIIFPGVTDDLLDLLYRRAAFCVYPSMYEGYGLPLVEGFARGKAVLASTAGALAEVAGPYSPCLDRGDEEAWFETLKLWIEDPGARKPYEAAIAQRFNHPTWAEAAAGIFAEADGAESPAPSRA